MANCCGCHTALLYVAQTSHSSQDVPVAKLCARFKGKRSLECTEMLVTFCLSIGLYFLTFQQETALLCSSLPITDCLLLPGVNIFSTLSFLPNTVTGKEEQA